MRPQFLSATSRWPLSETAAFVQYADLPALGADVRSDRRFVSTYRRYEITARPEMLAHKIALALSIYPRQVDCALPFDTTHDLRHRVLRRYRNHHVNMIGHQMTLFNPALLPQRQIPKHFP